MRDFVPTAIGLGIFALAFAGLAWQAWVAAPSPTAAQQQFVDVCERAMIGSFSFVFGYGIRSFARQRGR